MGLGANACVAVERGTWRRLIWSHTADDNLGASVALGTNRRTGHPTQHRQLADVRERVGQRTLYQFLDLVLCRTAQRVV